PTDQPDAIPFSTAIHNGFVRIIAHYINRVLLQNCPWNFRQNIAAQLLDGLHVWVMTKVANEKHSLAVRKRRKRRAHIFSVGNRMGQGLAYEIVNQIGFLLGNGQDSVRRRIDVQFTPHLVGIVGTESCRTSVGLRATEDAARLEKEITSDRVRQHSW